jgi:hypothetical protein
MAFDDLALPLRVKQVGRLMLRERYCSASARRKLWAKSYRRAELARMLRLSLDAPVAVPNWSITA